MRAQPRQRAYHAAGSERVAGCPGGAAWVRVAGCILAAALVPGTGGPGAQGLPAGAAQCIEALRAAEAAIEPGEEALLTTGEYCPDYADTLAASPWGETLPDDAALFLQREGLETLDRLAGSYATTRQSGLAPARLDALVAELEPFVAEPPPSFWERIGDWFRGWFEDENGERTALAEWLSRFEIPPAWERPILYTIAAIGVLAILAILVNELRLGGAFVGRAGRSLRTMAAGAVGARRGGLTVEQIRATPDARRRTELWFALVVERLRQRYRGRLAPGLTHRELVRAVHNLARDGLATGVPERIDWLGAAAERVTYAGRTPDEATGREADACGESILRAFDEAPGAA